MVIGISQTAFLCSCNGCAKRREEDYIVGVLLENVLDAFLDEAGHCEGGRNAVTPIVMPERKSMVRIEENEREVEVRMKRERR